MIEGNFTLNYRFEERYEVPSNGSFRQIEQSGDLSMTYHEQSRNWSVSNSFTREEETSAGAEPIQYFQADTTLTPVRGYWQFWDDNIEFGQSVQQRYYNPDANCSRQGLFIGRWEVNEVGEGNDPSIIKLEFFPLFYQRYQGSLVFFPFPYHDNSSYHMLEAQVLVDGEELILQNLPPESPVRQDTAFSSPDYGDVTVSQTYKEYYFSFRFRPKSEDGC